MNELETGLSIELWNRGMSWDKLLGVSWLPFTKIKYRSNFVDDVKYAASMNFEEYLSKMIKMLFF